MSQIFLIPVDDSETALRPVSWVVRNLSTWREPPAIHLLNVQASLPRDVSRFINAGAIRDFHLETGINVLTKARDPLVAAGLLPELHVLMGEAAPTITEFADLHGCSQILLGTRGHTGILGTLLGSVATKVVHLSNVPVLLIRQAAPSH
ncbi:MAG: universal stress protein [Rhodocyclaceae bacterium]|nr:universal stress protein [Rhodocyclaceae bacterium]